MSPKQAGPKSSPATSAAPPGAAAYLRQVETCFLEAERAAAAQRLDLTLAGRVLALRFASAELYEALAAAFAHLPAASDGAVPELTISIWDAESSATPPPPTPWSGEDIGPVGDVTVFKGGPIRVAVDASCGAITVVDLARGHAFFHVPASGMVPWSERAAPLRPALNWLLGGRGIGLVHAGAVGIEGRGVVLAGRGGSGKSTLAAAALLRDMEFAGDDYIALGFDPAPTAHSVHATVKLNPDSLAMLELDRFAPSDDEEKAVLYPRDWSTGALVDRLAISAIVVPRRQGPGPRPVRISGGEGLRALAPSTLFQLPGRDVDAFATMAALARTVPSYSISLDGDPGSAAAELERLVGRG